jgi:hypothetical protein
MHSLSSHIHRYAPEGISSVRTIYPGLGSIITPMGKAETGLIIMRVLYIYARTYQPVLVYAFSADYAKYIHQVKYSRVLMITSYYCLAVHSYSFVTFDSK